MKKIYAVLLLLSGAIIAFSQTNVWTGTGSWSNTSNWSFGHLPSSTEDAEISTGTCTLDQNGSTQDFTVSPGAALSFTGGKILSVYGDLAFDGATVGAEKIRIRGTGSQILSGSLSVSEAISIETGATLVTGGNLTIESEGLLVHGVNTPNGGGTVSGDVTLIRAGNASSTFYNTWSSPITTGDISDLGSDNWQFDPTMATPSVSDGWQTTSGDMTVGRGYMSNGAGTVSFTGTPNNGQVNIGVSDENGGYNLIGNPYPSSIEYDQFINDANNSALLNATIYFWDDDGSGGSDYENSDYSQYNAAGHVNGTGNGKESDGSIGSFQGFFVKATSSGTVKFKNSMRNSSNNDLFFKEQPIQRLRISIESTKALRNETLLAFTNDATDGYDRLYDGHKLKGNPEISFYSILEDEEFGIQALPEIDKEASIPIGMDGSGSGSFIMKIAGTENFDNDIAILVEDKLSGKIQNLRLQPEFPFEKVGGASNDRFIIHLKRINPSSETEGPMIRIQHPSLIIDNTQNNSAELNRVEIFNLSGRHIYHESVGNNQNKIIIDLEPFFQQYLILTIEMSNGERVSTHLGILR